MARLRRHSAYARLERANTRISKYKKKAFVKVNPHIKVISFDMGALNKEFEYEVNLISDRDIQIRDNALESARMSGNRLLETTLGIASYRMKLRKYPFHILRENPLASGAGADRFSTGMQKSFGKPIGNSARINKGEIIFSVQVNQKNIDVAKKALKRAKNKLPCSGMIDIVKKAA